MGECFMSVRSAEVKEQDKPFVLALVSAGILVLLIVLTGVAALWGNRDAVQVMLDIMKFLFPLITMAWSFYLGKKVGE
jgi:uncharacterized integral membrane protein